MFSSNTSAVSGDATFVEDVFSTYLYTGTSATATINNGIDFSGKGGMLWIKNRGFAANHNIVDTVRGYNKNLSSNLTAAAVTDSRIDGFTSSGFTLLNPLSDRLTNYTGDTYASWSFRKQPKFFDVVTYTGTGSARTVAHNLGSVPGMMIIKCTDNGFAWFIYHRSLGATKRLLFDTSVAVTESDVWDNTEPTATNFTLGNRLQTNGSGNTYVAYLFAHNAGGFGLTGTDNVISCGSYTGNGSATGPVVTLGYEPQWVLVKSASGTTANWFLYDTMRGFPTATGSETRNPLIANTTDNETTYSSTAGLYPTSTGFSINTSGANFNGSGNTYIYIAIRRGPMKVPTSGTSVFYPFYSGSFPDPATMTSGWPVDAGWALGQYTYGSDSKFIASRLTGTNALVPSSTAAEVTQTLTWDLQTALKATGLSIYGTSTGHLFRRAPSFFDVVCYTGTGVARTVAHNLTVVPELMIIKNRSVAGRYWAVYSANRGVANALALNQTNAEFSGTSSWNGTAPTSSVFTVNTHTSVNESGATYVAYLFATCAGVSKVGSYTGTATTKQVDCGFTAGARFVLIKRTDSTGDWYVWDSARGIVAGNDPYLLLNSTAPQNTGTDYVDTYSAGFEISSTAPAAINASGGTFIFLAIA